MQDAALFFRHLAVAAFHRRRRYPILSGKWRETVGEARRFVRYTRASWDDRPCHITRTLYALGSRVRDPVRDLHLVPGAEGGQRTLSAQGREVVERAK